MARFSATACLCIPALVLGACATQRSIPEVEKGMGPGRDLAVPSQQAAQATVPGCPYMSAPADSLVVEGNHHVPDLVYWPRSVTRTYSGCAYFWTGSRLYSVARFREGKVIDGAIQNLLESVWDDSDLPPMVYCKAGIQPAEGDCGRFDEAWTSWIEDFPKLEGVARKRRDAGKP